MAKKQPNEDEDEVKYNPATTKKMKLTPIDNGDFITGYSRQPCIFPVLLRFRIRDFKSRDSRQWKGAERFLNMQNVTSYCA